MIYTIGHISGCYLNPAVTLVMAVSKRMSWKTAVAYRSTELVGAVLGVGFIGLCYGFTKATQLRYGVTNFNKASTGYLVAIAAEIVGTAFLLFMIMGSAVDGRAVVIYDFITREAKPQSGDIHLTTLEIDVGGEW